VRLENGTTLAAHLFSGPAAETELGCAVLLKGTWEIRDGRLEPAAKSPWPIHLEPLKTPWGTFPGEVASRKPRTDLIVLGKAKAPRGEAVRQMTVSVSVGTFRHALAVFGDRVWERAAGGLGPSEPRPFREMPITWESAFGGRAATPVFEMANTDNPAGKGFVLEETDAEGVPLPNVEDPSALISSPRDLPRPVGWGPYPLEGGVRLSRMMDGRGRPLPPDVAEPWQMAWAHPDLVLPETPAPGTRIEVQGLAADAPIVATVPALPARVTLVHGSEEVPHSPRLDTLVVEAEERRLVARWRAATTFPMRPREVRLVRVEAA